MIEGEEVLESAQETGYRLCMAKQNHADDFSKVFSCCWDPNNRDRLFICSQKGSLRVYNLSTSSYTDYSVQFRRFTDADTQQDAKHISYHWDKLVAIPDRPDELIFLLGVTKSLMYSALPGAVPYPEQPYISKTTRGDFTGYIYGTPVMELWTHAARVTSVAVSQSGQILASGDEQGHLKLLMLRLIDNIIPTATKKANAGLGKNRRSAADPDAVSASTSKSVPQFSPFLPDYKCSLQAHNGGPIFSIAWLPIPIYTADDSVDFDLLDDTEVGAGAKRTRYYALATCSADRAVRIWGISCSSSVGLKATPIFVLDTLSTHILSLNAYLSVVSSQFGGGDNTSSTSTIASLSDDKGMNKQGQLKYRTGSGSSVYIAAGTNIGAVYVWQIPTSVIFAMATSTRKPKLIDDGSCLHSLVQTSDRPIVSVALSLSTHPSVHKRKTMFGFAPGIVLAASDTAGCVRTHRQCDDELHSPTHSPRNKGAAGDISKSNSGSTHPITVTGEAFFPNTVVVACAFQENPKNFKYQTPGDTWTVKHIKHALGSLDGEDNTDENDSNLFNTTGGNSDSTGNSWYSSRLLVGTSDGNVNIVKTDDAMHPTAVGSASGKGGGADNSKSVFGGASGSSDSDSDSGYGRSGNEGTMRTSQKVSTGAVSFMSEATVASGSISTAVAPVAKATTTTTAKVTGAGAGAGASARISRLQLDTSLTMLEGGDRAAEGDISLNAEVREIPRSSSPYTDDAPPALSSSRKATAKAATSSTNSAGNMNVTFGLSDNEFSLQPSDAFGNSANNDNYGESDGDSDSDNSSTARPRPSASAAVPTVFNKIDAGRTPRNASGQQNTYKAGKSPRAADLVGSYNTDHAGKTPRSGRSSSATAGVSTVYDFPDDPEIVRSSSSSSCGRRGGGRGAGVTFVSPSASAEARFAPPVPSPAPIRSSSTTTGSKHGKHKSAATADDDADDDEEGEEEEEAPPPPATAPPKPQSRLAAPQPNSSKTLQKQMLQLKSKIDKVMSVGSNIDDEGCRGNGDADIDIDDLLSISTFETTDSDRLAGRIAAMNALNVPQHMPRYEVTPVLDIADPLLLYADGRQPAQIKKSVDPAWLMRRQTQGPAMTDLQALYAPDPVVHVAIHSPASTSSTAAPAGNQSCVGGKHDLHCKPDQDTYHPVFSNKLVFTQLFGFGSGASGEGNAAIDRDGNMDMTTGIGAQWSDDCGFLEQAYASELLTM